LLTNTSARAIRRFIASSPSGCLKSRTIERLLRLKLINLPDMPGLRLPCAMVRKRSPPGASTLMTSAP
jgi:hypothetical protein